MSLLQADVFVQGKTARTAEVEAAVVMPAGEFVVDGQRGRPCCQAEHRVGLPAQQGLDGVGRKGPDLFAPRKNNHFHGVPPFRIQYY